MALKPKEVEKLLLNKFGFSPAPNIGKGRREHSHKWFELELPGLPMTIRTKVSRHRMEISADLDAKMAHQLRVRPSFYREMMSCTKSRDAYYQQIRSDPYPPFPF